MHFYEWRDKDEDIIKTHEPISTFTPITGDVVTFGDHIPHCPGNFKTDSESPKIRGVFAIFIKHPCKTPKKCMSWLSCYRSRQ